MNKKNEFFLKIDYEHCKGCEFCVLFCQKKVLKISDEVNKLGYRYVKVVDQRNCNGCGSCYIMCPDYLIEIYQV